MAKAGNGRQGKIGIDKVSFDTACCTELKRDKCYDFWANQKQI